ncbi:MAG: hypothetical protein K2M94_05590 [Paramuribaculum sp.]|nr:hypothetical protein [Paramuribaculum sp.]
MKTQDILSKVNHDSGLTVPPGYFDSFNKQMIESLPVQPWESERPIVLPRSFWQRVRPYVYMAAMFAGIWCMMKMFDLMRPSSNNMIGFSNNSELTAAISNDEFYYDYCMSSLDETTMYDALFDEGFNPEELNN